jgi:hypothetical protein
VGGVGGVAGGEDQGDRDREPPFQRSPPSDPWKPERDWDCGEERGRYRNGIWQGDRDRERERGGEPDRTAASVKVAKSKFEFQRRTCVTTSTLRELGLNLQNGVALGNAEVEPALVVAGNTALFNPDIEKNGPKYTGESALVQNEHMHEWGQRGAGQDDVGRRGASVQGWGSSGGTHQPPISHSIVEKSSTTAGSHVRVGSAGAGGGGVQLAWASWSAGPQQQPIE